MSKLTLHIDRPSIRFSSAHMTVFPDGSKESLHGHNYQVFIEATIDENRFLPFSAIKELASVLAGKWHEKVLLAAQNRHFHLREAAAEVCDFTLCNKHYVLPSEDVVLLPVENVTCENLAKLFAAALKKQLGEAVLQLMVRIEEYPGQGASYSF